jgi:hypothetical protein
MPLITGIFALSLVGVATDDPILDRQFAFVKKDQPAACVQDAVPVVQERPASVPFLSELPILTGIATAPQSPVPARPVEGFRYELSPGLSPFGPDGLSQLASLKKIVTINMENRSATDVLKWLAKQGVNYVVNVDTLPKSKVSINMVEAPLHEILSSLGDVLGGSWNVRGKTLVFRQGNSYAFSGFGSPAAIAPFEGALKLRAEADKVRLLARPMQERAIRESAVAAEKSATAERIMRAGADMVKENRVDVKKFLESMTSKQKELMRKQGHLHVKDLTPDQIKMLRIDLDENKKGDFFMTMTLDGEKVVIKNDPK